MREIVQQLLHMTKLVSAYTEVVNDHFFLEMEGVGKQHIYAAVICLYPSVNMKWTRDIHPYAGASHSSPG